VRVSTDQISDQQSSYLTKEYRMHRVPFIVATLAAAPAAGGSVAIAFAAGIAVGAAAVLAALALAARGAEGRPRPDRFRRAIWAAAFRREGVRRDRV
jgi:hypothetical protein